jgi:ribosomal protein S18 acetylase RimI-like enzyme
MAAVVRPACAADLEVLLGLHEEFSREDGVAFEPVAARAALTGLLREPSLGGAWIIEHEGRPAGYLVLCFGYSIEFRGRDAFLDEVYVRPAARGRGLARQALEVAQAACLEAGVRALHLEVRRDNQAARDLYRRSGFVERESYLMTRKLR